MCGRFSLTTPKDAVEEIFAVAEIAPFPPRYNIAPTQPVLAIVAAEPAAPGENRPDRRAVLARWGFWPSWVKDPREFPLVFNARGETAAEKLSFRAAMRHRRVLIPASGFYEWKRTAEGRAQPYWARAIRPPVALAGVMETWASADGSEIDTVAILTTSANRAFSSIHARMPLVVGPEDFARWLDCRRYEPREVTDLIRPPSEDVFEAVAVSTLVNSARNTSPDVQERARSDQLEEEPAQKSLF